jgi:hypothetical protein
MQQTRTTDHETLDDALIQCLRIFARHGRKVRTERQSVWVLQMSGGEKNTEKKELKLSSNSKSL